MKWTELNWTELLETFAVCHEALPEIFLLSAKVQHIRSSFTQLYGGFLKKKDYVHIFMYITGLK